MALRITIKTEEITVTENLLNRKHWFNGMKVFSSVKVLPARLNEPDLGIYILETIHHTESIRG